MYVEPKFVLRLPDEVLVTEWLFSEAIYDYDRFEVKGLTMQHRSIPAIGNMVSKFAYDGLVESDPNFTPIFPPIFSPKKSLKKNRKKYHEKFMVRRTQKTTKMT